MSVAGLVGVGAYVVVASRFRPLAVSEDDGGAYQTPGGGTAGGDVAAGDAAAGDETEAGSERLLGAAAGAAAVGGQTESTTTLPHQWVRAAAGVEGS